MKQEKTGSVLLPMLAMITAAFLTGCACAGSLRPVSSPETLTTVPDLEGTWLSKNADSPDTVTVTRAGEKSYWLRWKEKDKETELIFDLSLMQIDEKLFFDAAFHHLETKQESATVYDLGVVPIHFIGRIWIDEKAMRVGLLKYEWLKQRVDAGQAKLPYLEHHSKEEDLILFNAEAEDMQAFLQQYAEDREAFETASFEKVAQETAKP